MKAALPASILLVALACVLHITETTREFFAALLLITGVVLPVSLIALAILVALMARGRRTPRRVSMWGLLLCALIVGGPSMSRAEERIYPARVLAVHDGDTVTADLDLGFDLTYRAVIRLHGLDAPELPTPDGLRSRDALRDLLQPSLVSQLRGVRLSVVGREKYGRVLGTVYVGSTNVNAWLLQKGYARPYDGGKR